MKHPFRKLFHPWLGFRLNRLPHGDNLLFWDFFYAENSVRHDWFHTYKKKVNSLERESDLGTFKSPRSLFRILKSCKRAVLNKNMPKKLHNLKNRLKSLEGNVNKKLELSEKMIPLLQQDISFAAKMRLKRQSTPDELRLIEKGNLSEKEIEEQRIIQEICRWYKEKLKCIKDILKPQSA